MCSKESRVQQRKTCAAKKDVCDKTPSRCVGRYNHAQVQAVTPLDAPILTPLDSTVHTFSVMSHTFSEMSHTHHSASHVMSQVCLTCDESHSPVCLTWADRSFIHAISPPPPSCSRAQHASLDCTIPTHPLRHQPHIQSRKGRSFDSFYPLTRPLHASSARTTGSPISSSPSPSCLPPSASSTPSVS